MFEQLMLIDGVLYWRATGKRAGHLNPAHGNVDVRVNKKCYYAQRIVWMMVFGSIPDGAKVCHRNGVKTDNRPENLYLKFSVRKIKEIHEKMIAARGLAAWFLQQKPLDRFIVPKDYEREPGHYDKNGNIKRRTYSQPGQYRISYFGNPNQGLWRNE